MNKYVEIMRDILLMLTISAIYAYVYPIYLMLVLAEKFVKGV